MCKPHDRKEMDNKSFPDREGFGAIPRRNLPAAYVPKPQNIDW
jgi:hypothetical protein